MEIALVQPEIPGNTGAIGRLCVGTNTRLHLLGKLGFDLSERAVRRAGLDYWRDVQLEVHPEIEPWFEGIDTEPQRKVWLFTTKGTRRYDQIDYGINDVLVFGGESKGLPQWLRDRYPQQLVYLPTLPAIRSLNLASTATAALFEALRHHHFEGIDRPR
ncbi:MAG TPA: tRNA (uridine(34)/cytosine(34)/5-carboxymethylaminomethyluridine(34)-2'-O)-methyltransferase TrmL [Myxococcales bacterium]|nr:tRNA (uridine(34)/cytosine(34)/5-carboxymethylaminomethyluridine(34)-2'-O)-methyltransferase TrmL [Myxococcales bacterium]HAN32515.1 tRNA (uridine(34)/cytosine(34)/5-carboxymethylaminomethyluridine(34)-2'-O)-methyltransferase TrmL [Myxococcales bacterium]|tara:strand:- start:671 stop:1147 length:477 start_codon:yes stop_codon:yes gene_type:complete